MKFTNHVIFAFMCAVGQLTLRSLAAPIPSANSGNEAADDASLNAIPFLNNLNQQVAKISNGVAMIREAEKKRQDLTYQGIHNYLNTNKDNLHSIPVTEAWAQGMKIGKEARRTAYQPLKDKLFGRQSYQAYHQNYYQQGYHFPGYQPQGHYGPPVPGYHGPTVPGYPVGAAQGYPVRG